MKNLSLAIFLVGVAVTTAPADAQPQSTFAEPLEEAVNDAGSTYQFIRCSALFQAIVTWAGTDRLGADTVRTSNENVQAMATIAALIFANETTAGDLEGASQLALNSIATAMNIYLARFEQNFATTGQAFQADNLVTSDLAFCNSVAILAVGALNDAEPTR